MSRVVQQNGIRSYGTVVSSNALSYQLIKKFVHWHILCWKNLENDWFRFRPASRSKTATASLPWQSTMCEVSDTEPHGEMSGSSDVG